MNSIPLTDLIAELHQLFNTLLVGMVILSVLKADRVHHQVAVDMLPVNVSSDYNFIFVERFLRKLHRNFVCKRGFNFISAGETLHSMK